MQFYQTALGNCYCSLTKNIVSFIIIFCTLSFPIDSTRIELYAIQGAPKIWVYFEMSHLF